MSDDTARRVTEARAWFNSCVQRFRQNPADPRILMELKRAADVLQHHAARATEQQEQEQTDERT